LGKEDVVTRWDYKTVKFETSGGVVSWSLKFDQEELQQCLFESGAEEWELVEALTLAGGGWTKYLVLIFKRPISEDSAASIPVTPTTGPHE
jgi:hypothetical protein